MITYGKDKTVLLKIENIKLSPDAGMAALTAEVARLLKVREKELTNLRILRRSVDARDGVYMVYTVEAAVKDEAAVLRRCHNKRVSRLERRPGYLLPSPLPAPEIPRWWWAPDRQVSSPPWSWPGWA